MDSQFNQKTRLKALSHDAGVTSKCSFISTVTPTVHTNLFRKEPFKNTFQTEGIWKRLLFVLVWTKNIFWKEPFKNTDVTIITWFLCQRFLQKQLKMACNCCVSNFSRVAWTENSRCVFKLKAFVQKGRISLFWPIFIFCRIELIFGRLTCFDRKSIVP